MKEIWKDIAGYEGLYQVSNLGRVKSLPRVVIRSDGRPRTVYGKMLEPAFHCKSGYPLVTLCKPKSEKKYLVHRLVLEAFVGPCPNGHECRHFPDPTPSNIRLDNLQWGTAQENANDKTVHESHPKGERNGHAKLTNLIVVEMRKLYATGQWTLRQISEKFNISQMSASEAIRGKTWRHVAATAVAFIAVCISVDCKAQTYVYSNDKTILYQKIPIQTPYYQYGRLYYTTTYEYRKVADVHSPDWREQILNLIDKEKERQSFYQSLSHLGAAGLLAPQGQLSQTSAYPSATGNTLGGFTSLHYSRYGDVSALDINKANELAQQGADQVTRMASELNAIASGTAENAASLQKLNQDRVGGIAELQEMRAAYREMAATLKDQGLIQVEIMRALKPSASESLTIERGVGTAIPDGALSLKAGKGGQWTQEMATLAQNHCAACHGKGKSDPAGGFTFDASVPITDEQFGSLYMRMDAKAPAKRANGKAYRMPEGDDSMTAEQRQLIVDAARLLVQP